MKYYKILLLGLVIGSLAIPVQESCAAGKKKKKETADSVKTAPKATAYDKLFKGKKGVVHKKGVMTIHKVEDKIYLEVPVGIFGRDLLVDTHIDRTSDVGLLAPGQKAAPSQRLRIDRTDSLVLFRKPAYNVYAKGGDANVESALRASRIGPIVKTFPIAAVNNDSTAVVFNATSYFQGSNNDIVNLRGVPVGEGLFIYENAHIADRSQIDGVEAFNNSIAVSSEVGIRLTLAFPMGILDEKPETSAGIVTSLTLLPNEKMKVRKADPRIGTSYVRYTSFSDKGSKEGYFAGRWKLEAKEPEKIRRGELSEPVKPIVIYIDTLFSENWARAIRTGIEKWNPVLEQAGFERAIRVERYPSDSAFRADDPLISRVVYSASTGNTVTLNRLPDPRTGEILSVSLTVPRDFAESARKEAVYTIANTARRYAGYYLSDEAVCEVLTAKVMQRMAAALGLAPNLAGSMAYSPEQLRDPAFTQKYGFTASVTDDVLFNYAARPGDRERGVATIIDKPGIYDEFAVKWLYTPLESDEKETLDKWLAEKAGDPRFFYGKQSGISFALDPRAQKGDLGSDITVSMAQNIENLKFIIANAPGWLKDDSIPESYKDLFPDFVFLKVYDYVRYLSGYIGGIYQNEPHADNMQPANIPVPAHVQKQALKAVLELCEDLSWMDANREFMYLGGPNSTLSALAYTSMPIMQIMNRVARMALSVEKSEAPYTQEEALNDIATFIFKDVRKGKALTPARMTYAGQYIAFLLNGSPVLKANLKKAKSNGKSLADEAVDPFSEWEESNRRIASIRCAAGSASGLLPDDLTETGVTTQAMQPTTTIYYYFPKNTEPVYFGKMKDARRDIQRAIGNCNNAMDRGALKYYLSLIDMALTGK